MPRGFKYTFQKRRRERGDSSSSATGECEVEMEEFFERALVLHPSVFTFDADSGGGRIELARRCWGSSPIRSAESLSLANPELAGVLRSLIINSYRPVNEDSYEQRQFFRVEGILSNLMRMQSQKPFPLITVRLSIAAYRAQLPEKMWNLIHAFAPGILASHQWTHTFIEFAVQFRPPCEYEELQLVGGTMFDNYSRKVLYKSQATNNTAGYLLNMTNWATMTIPKLVAPANFDAHRNCELNCRLQCTPLCFCALLFLM